MGQSVDLHLGHSVSDRALNRSRRKLDLSSSVRPEGLLSFSISLCSSISAAADAGANCSAFSASLRAVCRWISLAVGSRSSMFSGMGDPSCLLPGELLRKREGPYDPDRKKYSTCGSDGSGTRPPTTQRTGGMERSL